MREVLGKDRVFQDNTGGLRPGDDFAETIDMHLRECDVFLAVIGPNWLKSETQEEDWVMIETARALGLRKRVIPVLVNGAQMPGKADLPADVHPLVRRHATILSNDRFETDAEHFANELRGLLDTIDEERKLREKAATQIAKPTDPVARRTFSGTPKLMFAGVGTAGGHMLDTLVARGLAGLDFAALQSDSQALSNSRATTKLQLGVSVLRGLGAGARPENGQRAAEESIENITGLLIR